MTFLPHPNSNTIQYTFKLLPVNIADFDGITPGDMDTNHINRTHCIGIRRVSKMDIRSVLNQEKTKIEKEIEVFFQVEKEASLHDPLITNVLDSIREYTLRDAKRVRSILAVMGYRAVGGKDLERARKASISLEMIQTMLLIHDDIIDRSHTRRGLPSFHRLYEALHRDMDYRGESGHFGRNMAIIAGDLAESFGEKALLRSGFPNDRILDALLCQTDMIRDTGYGQVFDLYSVELPEWTEDMVLKVHTYKTARYTLDSPLRIGAHLHGATPEQLSALSGFAVPVGVAFQLIDDILGFFGDPKRGGPSDLSDLKEGKRTLLIIKAIENAEPDQKKRLIGSLGSEELEVEEAGWIRDLIKDTGSEDYSRELAMKKTEEGISSLEGAHLDPWVVEFLKEFADYLVSRV
jgi:geranylgeranyl diphosphate synthase type I